jgi:thioredoxin reductase (NADPH)
MRHTQLAIIGSGPAALTAALYAARAQLKPLVIEGTKPGGQLMGTTTVENWIGDISVDGPALMQRMRTHAEHFGAEFVAGDATIVELQKKPFSIKTTYGETITSDSLIIATGSTPRRLNCPGETDYWGRGVTTCAVCDGAFYKNMPVIIIGGGDTAMEDASFMARFTENIRIIHIKEALTASKPMQERIFKIPFVKIKYQATVTAFHGNGEHLTSVTVRDIITDEETTFAASAAFLAIGQSPNTALFKGQLNLTPYGLIETTGSKTSIPGVFAVGDVVDSSYRQAIVAAGSGCMAALDAERYLADLSR